MHINELSLLQFKNYHEAKFDFDQEINCFVGPNGSGKTNVLDAIYYLSYCKSYLNPIDRQNIQNEADFFVLQAEFLRKDNQEKVYCAVKKGQKKKFKKNDKEYEKLADHIGQFPVVIISPYDRDLITEGSEHRRKFMDAIISQYDNLYLNDLIRYNKVVQHRNALLKQFQEMRIFQPENIEVWNAQMIDLGTKIYEKRKEFLESFIPKFDQYFKAISDGAEEVHIEYKSQLHEHDFQTLLKMHERKDQAATYSTAGTHKDDLLFEIGGMPMKKFGSQGQQKSYLIALKLAQFDFIAEHYNAKPILLLDDIFDKLDNHRVAQLMQLVSDDTFGQVFVTDTDQKRVEEIFMTINKVPKIFKIKKGAIDE